MKTLWRSSFLTLVLVAIDMIALWQIWQSAYYLRTVLDHPALPTINPPGGYFKALPVLLLVWLLILAKFHFYAHHERIVGLNNIRPILWAVFWMVVACTVYNLTFKPDFGRLVIFFFGMGTVLYLSLSRTLFRAIKRIAVERGFGCVRVLVVGGGELGKETMLRIQEHRDIGFKIAGFVKAGEDGLPSEIHGYPVLGELEDLIPIIQRHQVEEVFFAVPDMKEDRIFMLIEEIQRKSQVVCKVVANMLYVIVNRAKVDEITGLPVIAFRGSELYPIHVFLKRLLDLVLGGILGVLMAVPALIFAIWVKLDSKGPVLFVHERVGLNGRIFPLLKFRTMTVGCDPYSEAPQDETDPRVTRFGRLLRMTSLDEIPQLINVLKGEMSLVGPRPEMPFIVLNYQEWEKARLRVKPGLTGLWQVAGRKNLPLHFNLEYDFYYVKNQSLALDLEILLLTVPAVLLGRGAY